MSFDVVSVGSSYALAAAAVWGVFLFYFKRNLGDYPPTVALVLTSVFGVAWYLPVTGYALWGGASVVPSSFGVTQFAFAALTVVLFALALLTFYAAIGRGTVSLVTPISKIHPVFVVPMEVLVLGAHVAPLQVVGIVLATVAVYLANYSGDGLLLPLRRLVSSRPAQLGLLSAVLMALVNVSQRALLYDFAMTPQVWVVVKNGGVALLLAPLAARRWSVDVRGNLPTLAVAGLFVATGEHLVALAYAGIPASVAAPLISLQAIVAVVLAGVLLDEDDFLIRLVAALVAILGIAFVTLPQ